jgi:propanol-preferring alcohol dehydrogenase
VEGDLALPRLPTIPGHQIVGRVDAIGAGVTRYQVGDRLGIPWLYWTCGRCCYCLAGKENLCENIRFTGLHVDGGFAEYTLVGESFAYPIPDIFSDVEAAPLLCAGIVGYRSLRLSRVQPGQRLGLYGFGASAHLIIQVARYWNCEVFVFTRSEHHRKLARTLGAAWAGGAEDDPGALMDSSIIFAPAGSLVPAALRILDKGGVLALGGIHMSPIPEMPYDLLWHERTIQSVANSTRQDAIDFLRVAAEVPVKTEIELFPLEQANEALLRLKRSKINGAAVLQVSE